MPERIQLKRTKGWRMPPNTVKVDRTTRWGNPYWDTRRYGLDLCLKLFENTAQGVWNPGVIPKTAMPQWFDWLYEHHCEFRARFSRHPLENIQQFLAGRNLACWCALDKPCHADILIRLANQHPTRDEHGRA